MEVFIDGLPLPDDDIGESEVVGKLLVAFAEARAKPRPRKGVIVQAFTAHCLYRVGEHSFRCRPVGQVSGMVDVGGFVDEIMISDDTLRPVGHVIRLAGDERIFLAEYFSATQAS